MLLANPDQVALLKQQNPRLAEALNNPEEFTKASFFKINYKPSNKYFLSWNRTGLDHQIPENKNPF